MNGFSVPGNQRSHPRYRVSKEARVSYPAKREFVDVVIKDMSVGGARIQLKSSTDLWGQFNLFIPAEQMLYTASVRWMKGDQVGLQFVSEPESVALKMVT